MFPFVQVAPGGVPSARCLWQMDALCAQGVSDPSTCPGQLRLWELLIHSSFKKLAHLSLHFHIVAPVIFITSPTCADFITSVSPGAVCLLFCKWELPLVWVALYGLCLSSPQYLQAYQFRPLKTPLTFQLYFLLSSLLDCGRIIVWSPFTAFGRHRFMYIMCRP